MFLSSTARLTAAVPFQVLSDGRYLYVLRQAIADPTAPTLDAAHATIADANAGATDIAAARDLLIDHEQMLYVLDDVGRPVLDLERTAGAAGRPARCSSTASCSSATSCSPSWRCASSAAAASPGRSPARTASAQPISKVDRSSSRRRSCASCRRLSGGRFSALLVPTQVADVFRWQLFAVHAADGPDLVVQHRTVGRRSVRHARHAGLHVRRPCRRVRPGGGHLSGVERRRSDAGVRQAARPVVPTAVRPGPRSRSTVREAGRGLDTGRRDRVVVHDRGVDRRRPTASIGDRSLFGAPGADQAHTGPSVWIADGTKIGVGLRRRLDLARVGVRRPAGRRLAPPRGHLRRDGPAGVPRWFPRVRIADLDGIVPVATAVTEIAGAPAGFAGTLDEVRIWEVARGASSLRAGMHRRLTGLEPGPRHLLPSRRGARNRGRRSRRRRRHRVVTGATWVTSDAPDRRQRRPDAIDRGVRPTHRHRRSQRRALLRAGERGQRVRARRPSRRSRPPV